MSRQISRDIRARVAADIRGGTQVALEDLVVAALVALPFAGALGIFLNVATGWPTPIPLVAMIAVEALLTFWIAGFRRRKAEA